MAKSDLLRLQDVRDAYRLIGECRDLGSDPALWCPRMLEGLCRLIGAPMATGGEGQWSRPGRPVQVMSAFDVGLDSHTRERYIAYHRELGPAGDPVFRALQHVPGRVVTYTRRQLIPNTAWYGSVCWNDYYRPAHIDHQLTSVHQTSDEGAISAIALVRASGERDFSPRERQVLDFFHEELGPLIGRSLVSVLEPSPERLSPRLRQTLGCLLEGDSEKQVAARLNLSHATTHQYVTALYRRFRVQSRAQLLAHVMRRMGQGQWRRLAPG
ncbi:MAG TPA: LuxR C-terminal-related transcriptional regulator [Gemmatimonadales bacterium]|nr:LuxR C-terminal-related transcriptional regulator [Gemmatimonadales bacterium]